MYSMTIARMGFAQFLTSYSPLSFYVYNANVRVSSLMYMIMAACIKLV